MAELGRGDTHILPAQGAFPDTPSHCYLPPAGARGGHLMQLLPQATQMAERPFPRDLRFKSGLDGGSAYPEEMNWELWNFRQQQEA